MPWAFLLKSGLVVVFAASVVGCSDRKGTAAAAPEPVSSRSGVQTAAERKEAASRNNEAEFLPLQTSLLSFWGGDPNDLDSLLAALRKITSTVPGPAGDQTKAAYIVE